MTIDWGPAPVDGAPTNVPGVYLLKEAFGDLRPFGVMEVLEGAMKEYVAEFGESGTMETWLATGNVAYVKGRIFVEFRTISVFSWCGWVGKYPGRPAGASEYVCVEELEEL
jgi:hypothetical protein